MGSGTCTACREKDQLSREPSQQLTPRALRHCSEGVSEACSTPRAFGSPGTMADLAFNDF